MLTLDDYLLLCGSDGGGSGGGRVGGDNGNSGSGCSNCNYYFIIVDILFYYNVYIILLD